MQFSEITESDIAASKKKWADEFPGSKFGCLFDIKQNVLDELNAALDKKSEEEIQKVLTLYPYLIQYAVDRSGHHGIWAFPKPTIKPPGADGTKGLIPDFLIVTRSSLGYFCYIVELKRFDIQFSNSEGTGFSPEGHKAIAQCNEYLAYCREHIETVRTNIGKSDLQQPNGAIILIGNSKTESDVKRRCRENYVRSQQTINVVSYQRIIAGVMSDLHMGMR